MNKAVKIWIAKNPFNIHKSKILFYEPAEDCWVTSFTTVRNAKGNVTVDVTFKEFVMFEVGEL
jgi:hypothetical protein